MGDKRLHFTGPGRVSGSLRTHSRSRARTATLQDLFGLTRLHFTCGIGTLYLPLLTKPKGLANSRRWVLLKEEKQEGTQPDSFSCPQTRWDELAKAHSPTLLPPWGIHSHQGACNLVRASGAAEPNAQGLTPGLWLPIVSYPTSPKLYKLPL